MRIAFVKQDVYQDLYIGAPRAGAADLLFSSIMRVGPIGLFTRCDADFYIVQVDQSTESQTWRQLIPHGQPEWYEALRHAPFAESPLPEARFLRPGSSQPHSAFSVAPSAVDWSAYDIVIGINFPFARATVAAHPRTLWCYMVGEANRLTDRVHHGYDVCLNQETRGIVASGSGVIDFPYTFVGPDCLETLLARTLGRPSARQGIYIEVNSVHQRPARIEPHLLPLASDAHPLRMHRQNIRENLTELYDARYFVKAGGRHIRGNSVIEAISCGVVVLMNPAELHHAQLLPRACWIHSVDDARRKIAEFERDPAARLQVLAEQRARLAGFVFDAPWESLQNALAAKRASPPPPPRTFARRVASRLARIVRGRT